MNKTKCTLSSYTVIILLGRYSVTNLVVRTFCERSRLSAFSNIETILEAKDLPEKNITLDTYNDYIVNNDVSSLNLTSCVVEEFLDTVGIVYL